MHDGLFSQIKGQEGSGGLFFRKKGQVGSGGLFSRKICQSDACGIRIPSLALDAFAADVLAGSPGPDKPEQGSAEDLLTSSDLSGYLTGAMKSKTSPPEKGTTTMYVSSALCGRHGLCVLLENVDQAGTHRFGMIDTGNAGSTVMKSFLVSHGVKTLDFLILTHMHKDHIGNALYLLKHHKVKSLYLKQFDAHWSDGVQSSYESILRAAASNTSTTRIVGVSCALSLSPSASPSASAGFVSWLKSHGGAKSRFKGLFSNSNTSFRFGSSTVQLFNWEIWSADGITKWQPGKTLRCKASAFSTFNSDNNFSLGIRVAQGNRRIWIGGDMNNLRLTRKTGLLYKGDEDRLRASIGPVDAMVMNHHGRGGSNSPDFLRTLSPDYVVYTSLRSEVESAAYGASLRSLLYLENDLHLSEDRILWAGNYWKSHPEDPVITISSSKLVSSIKDGTDMVKWKGAGGANCAAIPLLPGHTYTSYDVTGDGKADFIQIISAGNSYVRNGLQIKVNQQSVLSTKLVYSDDRPVTLLLQPGHRAFVCWSVLSPKDGKTRRIRLFRYQTISDKPVMSLVFDVLKNMPDKSFVCEKTPVLKVSAKAVTISCTGNDTLSELIRAGSARSEDSGSRTGSVPSATVTFRLTGNGSGLTMASYACKYTIGKSSRISFSSDMPLYSSPNAASPAKELAAGTAVTVTHICKNRSGTVRWRIKTEDGQVFWVE